MSSEIKAFYAQYHDRIYDKRFNSPYRVRREVHREIYESVLRQLAPGVHVLDAGCGEGTLSCLMAGRGLQVTGVDFSAPNVEAARHYAQELEQGERVTFLVGDAEHLPFEDGSFECVVSNHVLEHLPDFMQGLRELYRVTRSEAIIAVPTCLSPLSWCLLGRDTYWRLSKRTPFALPFGLMRVLAAWLTGQDGVDETYVGQAHVPHVFRFPWVARRAIESVGFTIVKQEAQSLRLPYVGWRLDWLPRALREQIGIGTVYVARK